MKSKSMLIIEGSEIVARLFAEIFERRGWNVVMCNDRRCAFERLAGNEPYDVILVSYRVHGTDGLQLVRLIRALEHLRMTAVVMVTGTGGIMKEALTAGANAVLLKPINQNALVSTVEKHAS